MEIAADNYSLHWGDCLEVMRGFPDKSIDLVLCDLPYGTTQNSWDSIIPLQDLWQEYRRIAKGAIVLTATQPFSSILVSSNLSMFRYEWVWKKSKVTGVLNAKRQPLRQHEVVLVFSERTPPYFPQGLTTCDKFASTGRSRGRSSANYGKISETEDGTYHQTSTGYPRSVIEIASEGKTVHPTQKPVALMEYLIRTYSEAGDTVLDNCMGSGTTGVAAILSGRKFTGIERDPVYFSGCVERVALTLRKR